MLLTVASLEIHDSSMAAELQSPLAFGVEILKIDTLFANPSPHRLGSRF